MEIIKNNITGDSMRIFRSSLNGGDDIFELDLTLCPKNRWSKFPHFHPGATETFKVISGTLNMIVGDQEVVLTPDSKEVVIGNNVIHCFWNDTDKPVTFHSVISPAYTIERGIRATYALANAGRMNKMNLPRNLFELALLGELLDGYSPKLPWQVQKGLIKVLTTIGTVLGYRKRFDLYIQQYSKKN